jgi:hypothetical protein
LFNWYGENIKLYEFGEIKYALQGEMFYYEEGL